MVCFQCVAAVSFELGLDFSEWVFSCYRDAKGRSPSIQKPYGKNHGLVRS